MRTVPGWVVGVVGVMLMGPAAGQAPTLPPVQPPGQSGPGPGGGGGGNGALRQQIQAIRQRYKAQREQLQEQIRQQRDDLANMLRNNAPSSQTEAKLHDIIQSEGQREALLLQEYYEISAILPPRAREQYTERVVNQVLRRRANPAAAGPNGQPQPQQQQAP